MQPRAGGNSDRMATLFVEGFGCLGHAMDVTPLRQHDIRPCIACYRCAHDPHGWCNSEETDSSAPAFSILMKASWYCFSPFPFSSTTCPHT